MDDEDASSERWTRVVAEVPADPAIEPQVRAIVEQMTLAEKVGQMIQPELFQVTPEEVRDHKFGSVLNGAGLFPNGHRHADAREWLEKVNEFWEASQDGWRDRPFRIPFMWATDAVHGHNNLFGATIFPHNIGLGCIDDATLVREIAEATAREVEATGIDWIFSPNLTVPRDYRWGRHFEGYGGDPALVARYARAMVEGLQRPSRDWSAGVIACMKHWLADGGTHRGIDRGDCPDDEGLLRDVHASGYYAGIAAGGLTVMTSFSSWSDPANYDHSPLLSGSYNAKLAGSRYLVTDVLKRRMGFDGLVITDWDAHADVGRCSFGDAAFVINAGVDILMVSPRAAWKELYSTTQRQVEEGLIPSSRIDDAVTRILRVKMRAGLWDKPPPIGRPAARRRGVVGCPEHRSLARRAARRSAVLLKNNDGALPLARDARVLVTGSAAIDLRKQTGGWTLSWQGDDVVAADLPGSRTLADAVRDVVGSDRCVVDPALERASPELFDAVIVALGEDAYAEMRGTIRPWRSLSYAELKTSYAIDLDILRRLSGSARQDGGPVVVTLFFGGRPLYLTEEINLSDAFVAAWLPGPYNEAMTDLLFEGGDGNAAHDFDGRLSFSWPRRRRSFVLNGRPSEQPNDDEPLFPRGYGLSLAGPTSVLAALPLDVEEEAAPPAPAERGLDVLWKASDGELDWRICGHNVWSGQEVDFRQGVDLLAMTVRPERTPIGAGLLVRFNGYAALLYARYRDGLPRDFRSFVSAKARFELTVRVVTPPDGPVMLALHDDYPGQPALDISDRLREPGEWLTLTIPVEELADARMDLRNVDTPFMLYPEGRAELVLGGIRLLVGGSAG